jgi:hypothetical protein
MMIPLKVPSKNEEESWMNKIEHFLSVDTIRAQAARMFARAQAGYTHFLVHPQKLDETTDYVLKIIEQRYPSLQIPPHTRFRHFGDERLQHLDVRARIDLMMVSVLLDAGAGDAWRYTDPQTGTIYKRSEGLAIASYHMFCSGLFGDKPLSVNAQALQDLTHAKLGMGLQVSAHNPLVGLEGRTHLLHALGHALQREVRYFGASQRPSGLYDFAAALGREISALEVLSAVQHALGGIWPGRIVLNHFNLGDVWRYSAFGEDYVPFHKLSQWMTYSLLEPFESAGLRVVDIERLTGLAEYRNGGLFLDSGVLQLRDPTLGNQFHRVDSELIIEWRALTVHLLEAIASRLQQSLHKTPKEFPMAKVLEGGTWHAGRALADKLRQGKPPLNIVSDATVF